MNREAQNEALAFPGPEARYFRVHLSEILRSSWTGEISFRIVVKAFVYEIPFDSKSVWLPWLAIDQSVTRRRSFLVLECQ